MPLSNVETPPLVWNFYQKIMPVLLALICLANTATAFDWQTDVHSGDFTSESDPTSDDRIAKDKKQVTHVRNGTWLSYEKFDFGSGTSYLWIEAASANVGGKVELRLGSPSGILLGSVDITNTGGLDVYKPFGVIFPQPVKGVQDLFLNFVGGADMNCKLGKFRFQRLAPSYKPPGKIADWIKRDPVKTTAAGSFTSESNPADPDLIRSENGQITYIGDGNWVEYKDYDFGSGANSVTIYGSSENAGGTVELWIGNPTSGTLIGKVAITNTGSWNNFLPFSAGIKSNVAGVKDLYLRFVGSGWAFFNIRDFCFQQLDSDSKSVGRWIAAKQFDEESSPGVDAIPESDGITSLSGGAWVCYDKFNFGQGANLVTVMAATPNKGGAIEMWIDTPDGPLKVATLDVTFTGSWTLYREYTAPLSTDVKGIYKLYARFVDTNNQSGSLFNLKNFIFEKKLPPTQPPSQQGKLNVYDSVPNLAPSPYYTYSVQKVSKLNAPLKINATNWLSPFAWFTECKTSEDSYSAGYYKGELAGWSHTYCNFELGENTPIVVKITRNKVTGAPSGPIFMANAHPAHKVESCEVINGDVYVTMREPALVTIDIDGQMDTRDAPRSSPEEMASSKPYANKLNGSHAVSIFANPVIMDRPSPTGPGVYLVKPGAPLPPPNGKWTTLYFAKGVHHFSRSPNGSPGIWKNGDAYVLMSNKSCYIPGDAMIYGNFDGRAEESKKENVRVYGYGTLSGARMPHWQDPYWKLPAQAGTNYLDRPIAMSSGYNCRFEGITVADPANHGIAFDFGANNSRRWIKQIAWRANSDMGGIPGIVEDCFFRMQDDGPYVRGDDFRRNTLWFDCNGSPFRGSFMLRGTHDAGHQTVIEDCDIIYARANWGGEVFAGFDHWEIGTYPDGTRNTGQHMIFRNIRITDPRPTRVPFSFVSPANLDSGFAGIRFENIEYRHPHSWGRKSSFKGTDKAPIHHLYFDDVSINGNKLNETLFKDESTFSLENASNIIFRNP